VVGENLGLFGWPLAEPREKAGRPEHVPTDENRNKIMMLLVFGLSNKEIGQAVGLSQPTLRKHYLQQLQQRRVARLQLDATRWAALYSKAVAGDVSAIKELGKVLERHDQSELASRVANRGTEEPQQRKLGKKEQAKKAATEVDGKFAPPAAPSLLVN
jgi:DNA-binding transcriptional ArsR family regulator